MLDLVLTVALSSHVLLAAGAPADAPDSPLIVVFPFENTSEDRSLYWASEAIADGLSREIRREGGFAVDRSDRLSVTEDLGVPALSTLTLASQIRASEQLGATTLVTGRFMEKNGALTANVRVVDVAAGRIGPWIQATGASKDIYALQHDLYAALRKRLPAPTPPPDGLKRITGPPEDGAPQAAYEFLLKSFFEDAPKKREFMLRRALDLAPEYLRAQFELALVYRDTGQVDKASGILVRTVTRDRQLAADAQNLLAEIEIERGHSQAAEGALRSSLASLETARAHLLFARIAIAREDRTLARTEVDRARALDPDDPELAEVEEALAGAKK